MKRIRDKNIEIITFDDYNLFFEAPFNQNLFHNKNFLWNSYFRGHSDSSFSLQPSLLRTSRANLVSLLGSFWDDNLNHIELALLYKFYRSANHQGLYLPFNETLLSDIPFTSYHKYHLNGDYCLPNDLLQVAAIAQHYGLPTRLLDWSRDPYIALYFAVHDEKSPSFKLKEPAIVIWVLHHDEFLQNHRESNLRVITPPYFNNPNLNAQKGVFTHLMTHFYEDEIHFEKNEIPSLEEYFNSFEENSNPYLTKLVLDVKHKDAIKNKLYNLGYTKARVFPGYHSIVDNIKQSNDIISDSISLLFNLINSKMDKNQHSADE